MIMYSTDTEKPLFLILNTFLNIKALFILRIQSV